jgi:hypothetical protein
VHYCEGFGGLRGLLGRASTHSHPYLPRYFLMAAQQGPRTRQFPHLEPAVRRVKHKVLNGASAGASMGLVENDGEALGTRRDSTVNRT